MALKTFVKINSVNNLSDARYCAGMGVSVLGFNVDPLADSYISPEKYQAISEWISGPSFAAELPEKNKSESFEAYLKHYPSFDTLQLSRFEDLLALQARETSIIYKLVADKIVQNPADLEKFLIQFKDLVHYFLIELDQATQEELWLEAIIKLSDKFPLILGFGITADNVSRILSRSSLAGIALTGGDEVRPGYRDFDELADILEVLEVDDQAG